MVVVFGTELRAVDDAMASLVVMAAIDDDAVGIVVVAVVMVVDRSDNMSIVALVEVIAEVVEMKFTAVDVVVLLVMVTVVVSAGNDDDITANDDDDITANDDDDITADDDDDITADDDDDIIANDDDITTDDDGGMIGGRTVPACSHYTIGITIHCSTINAIATMYVIKNKIPGQK